MGRDLDGDYWCRDFDECNRIAKERLANPDAVWRRRRTVARLEWQQDPPAMFGLSDTVALFRLDGPAPPRKRNAVSEAPAAVQEGPEQLGLAL
jgi:hypothetical protein